MWWSWFWLRQPAATNGSPELAMVRTPAKRKSPTQHCTERGADWNDGSMPDKNVCGLKAWAVEFKHAHAGQAGQRTGDQPRGDAIDRKSAAKQ